MKFYALVISILVAGTFFFTHVDTLERTVHVQGENYKLKKLKNFANSTVDRVNIVGGRIFYKSENAWWLLNNVGGPDYTVNSYTELSCYVSDAHVQSITESVVFVKSKGLTVHIDKRCDSVWYCELNTLVIFTCANDKTNNPLTHFYFLDMGKILFLESTTNLFAERFPLLATDFPGYGGQSYARIHVDPLTNQIVFRMNNNYNKGSSIWSITKVTGKWDNSL